MATRNTWGPSASSSPMKSWTPSARSVSVATSESFCQSRTGRPASPDTPRKSLLLATTAPSTGAKIRTAGPVAKAARASAARSSAVRMARTRTPSPSAGRAEASAGTRVSTTGAPAGSPSQRSQSVPSAAETVRGSAGRPATRADPAS